MILNKNNKILFINQINNFNTYIDNINKTDMNRTGVTYIFLE